MDLSFIQRTQYFESFSIERIGRSYHAGSLQEKKYPSIRVILNCTETFVQRSSNLMHQNVTFSNYKHQKPFMFPVWITPSVFFLIFKYCNKVPFHNVLFSFSNNKTMWNCTGKNVFDNWWRIKTCIYIFGGNFKTTIFSSN